MSKLPEEYTQALDALAVNPNITKDEAARVLLAVSEVASRGELSKGFLTTVLGDEVFASGDNACGGGSNACAK